MGSPDRPGRHLVAVLVLLTAFGAGLQHLKLGAAVDEAGRLACIGAVVLLTIAATVLVAGGPDRR